MQLDRGKLVSFPGDYQSYLERREALLAEEEKQKSKQEAIDNLSARWTVNEVINQFQ